MHRLPQRLLFAALAALLVLFATLRAGAAFTPPPIQGAVTDTAGKLSQEDDRALEQRLAAYRSRTGNEVAVLVVGSLENESIEDVAYKTFNTWGIGKKGLDDGVLLVIAPNERRTRIETGKGIGDKLTDLESGRILRERVGPLLKQDRFRDAIEAGLDAIESALDGRPPPPLAGPAAGVAGVQPNHPLPTWGVVLIVLGAVTMALGPMLLIVWLSRRAGGSSSGGTSASSSSNDYGSSSGSTGASYTGGGGTSGGGGASDSY